jgi:ABC-type antimicrobial peptide transport system permease subunit
MSLITLCSLVVLASITVLQRKKEVDTLHQVGMTDRQIIKMLILEGICYATPVVILTFVICHFGVFEYYLSHHKFYEIVKYPLAEMIGVCVIIYLVSLLMPVLIYSIVPPQGNRIKNHKSK